MKKTIIYINGIKASQKDVESLFKDLRAGKQQATATTTKNGNIAITTYF